MVIEVLTAYMCVLSDDEGNITDRSELPNLMFLMHKWFTTSDGIAQAFVHLYPPVSRCLTFTH